MWYRNHSSGRVLFSSLLLAIMVSGVTHPTLSLDISQLVNMSSTSNVITLSTLFPYTDNRRMSFIFSVHFLSLKSHCRSHSLRETLFKCTNNIPALLIWLRLVSLRTFLKADNLVQTLVNNYVVCFTGKTAEIQTKATQLAVYNS